MTPAELADSILAAVGVCVFRLDGNEAQALARHLQRSGCIIGGPGDVTWLVSSRTWYDGLESLADTAGDGCGLIMISPDAAVRDSSEAAALASGQWRKHPRYHELAPYSQADGPPGPFVSLLERVPAKAERAHPLAGLAQERSLHMDMLRANGRRADAHTARYAFAADFVKPGDVVIDVACGYGYGSHILAANSPLSKVTGIDLSDASIAYAGAHYAQSRVTFEVGDATDLSRFADASVDLIASFETVEHLREPDLFFKEATRILRPGGRLVMSVPNRWLDETGKDPNPYHFQVYDPERVRADVSRHFIVDQMFGQTAGGNNLRCPHAPRDIFPIPANRDCEWVLAVAIKDPLGADRPPYEERMLPYVTPPKTALDWNVLFDDPWIGAAVMDRAGRPRNPKVLIEVADRILDRTQEGSADAQAALCVIGYQMLGQPPRDVDLWVTRMQRTLAASDPFHPAAIRWNASLHYLAALLLESSGQPVEAMHHYEAVFAIKVQEFHPSLLTKRVDAGMRTAKLAAALGEKERAERALSTAQDAAFTLLACDPVEAFGRSDSPHPFYLTEAARIMSEAAKAARATAAAKRGLGALRIALGEADEPSRSNLEAIRREARALRAENALLKLRADKLDRLKALVPAPLATIARAFLNTAGKLR